VTKRYLGLKKGSAGIIRQQSKEVLGGCVCKLCSLPFGPGKRGNEKESNRPACPPPQQDNVRGCI